MNERLMYHRWRADAEFAALSVQARDLFYALMGICDSWGCLKVNGVVLRNTAYPGQRHAPRLKSVEKWLSALQASGFLRCWSEREQIYGELKWFMEEQRIRWRRRRQTPLPPWRAADEGVEASCGGHETPATLQTLPNASDATDASTASVAEEKISEVEEKKSTLGAPEGTENQSQEGPGVTESDQARPGPSCDARAYGENRLTGESHHVQRAWALILERVDAWGPTYPGTVEALIARTRASPEHALAFVLQVDEGKDVLKKWAVLRHNLGDKARCPSDTNLQRAKDLIRGSPGPRNGAGTIGETLKNMEETG